MAEVKNYDIKTVSKVIGTNITSIGLGAVPSGMKRWVTFVRADNAYGGENKLFLVSTTSETYASTVTRASAAAKDRITLQAKEHFASPPKGPADPDFPLFSIAETAYLTALTNRGDVNLFMQYYDE